MHTKFWLENWKGRDLDVDGKIILEWIVGVNRVGGCVLDVSGSG